MPLFILLLLVFALEEGEACLAMNPGTLPCPSVPQTSPLPTSTSSVEYSDLKRTVTGTGEVVFTCEFEMRRQGSDQSYSRLVCMPDSGFFAINGVRVKEIDTFHCAERKCTCPIDGGPSCPQYATCTAPSQTYPCVYTCPPETYAAYESEDGSINTDTLPEYPCVDSKLLGLEDWKRGMTCVKHLGGEEYLPENTGCQKLKEPSTPYKDSNNKEIIGTPPYYETSITGEVIAVCPHGTLYTPSMTPGARVYITCTNDKWSDEEATCLPAPYFREDCLKEFGNENNIKADCFYSACTIDCLSGQYRYTSRDGTSKTTENGAFCVSGKLVTRDKGWWDGETVTNPVCL